MSARAGPAGGRGGGADGDSLPRGLGVRPAWPAGLWGSSGWVIRCGRGRGAPGFLIEPHWPLWNVHPPDQWEPKRNRSLRRGGWPATPRGVCGALSFLWGDASSARRLRVPGSLGGVSLSPAPAKLP